jgi:hypothetical protein
VQLELPEVEEVSRAVWSRDRSPKPQYSDRLATQYEIAVSLDGQAWTTVATHADRLAADYVHAAAIGPIATAAGLSPNELAELESLEETVAGLEKQRATLTTLPKAYAGQFVKPPKTHRFFRGDPVQPREEIPPGSLSHFGSPWQLPADSAERDRRRALAGWIVAPSNPLAARVIVNRVWHYHFGTGIVDTPSDFGVNGGSPTHPELLDWQATELVDPANPADRWRLKRIHRLIVTSRAFGTGLSGIALAALLPEQRLLGGEPPIRPAIDPAQPFAPRAPHFAPKAKNVLMIFCSGALSHVDTFDYKPELVQRHDPPLPMPGGGKLITFQGEQGNLIKPLWDFKPRGESGTMTSELLPHLGALADEMCFIHSMTAKSNTHGPAETQMSTGFTLDGFPSIGAWTTYALGSECRDLPAFVAIPDPRGVPQIGPRQWQSAFLPAVFQGTPCNADRSIANLARPAAIPEAADLATRDFLRMLNDDHLARHPGDTDLAARISAYELAAKMQLSAAKVALDHTRLSFYNNGIERRLTDVRGHVIEEILA